MAVLLQNILKNNPTFNSDQQFLNEAGIFDIDKFKALISLDGSEAVLDKANSVFTGIPSA